MINFSSHKLDDNFIVELIGVFIAIIIAIGGAIAYIVKMKMELKNLKENMTKNTDGVKDIMDVRIKGLERQIEDYNDNLEKYRVESLELSKYFRDVGFKVISDYSTGNKK